MTDSILHNTFRTLRILAILLALILFPVNSTHAQNPQSEEHLYPENQTEKSESEEQAEDETLEDEESSEEEHVDGEEEFIDPDEIMPFPDTPQNQLDKPSQRDLDEMFQKAKDAKSLEQIIKQESGRISPPPIALFDPDFVGPVLPPSRPRQIEEETAHSFVGPLPPPDIDYWRIFEEEDDTEDDDYTEAPVDFDYAMPPEDRKYIDLSADTITRDKLNNIILLEGNAKVVYEDVVILSEFAEFNDEEEWGKFWGPGGVLAESNDGLSRSERLKAFFADDEKIAYLHDNVEIFVYGRDFEDELDEDAPRRERMQRALSYDDTTIYCDQATYNWGKKIFHAWVDESDLVKIVQDGRYAHALAVYADRERDLTILEGKVKLWHKNGDWLFDRDVIVDKEDKWANALLRPETTITCDILEMDGEEEITTLEGNVLAVQKEKRASSDLVIHNEKEEIFIADGNVRAHQDKGDWLIKYDIVDPEEESEETIEDIKKPTDIETDKFTFWMEEGNFLAEGNCKLIQENQDVSADTAEYIGEIDSLRISGNVVINRLDKDNKDNQLISDKGILWLTTKVYEAFGNVKSSTKIDVDAERR